MERLPKVERGGGRRRRESRRAQDLCRELAGWLTLPGLEAAGRTGYPVVDEVVERRYWWEVNPDDPDDLQKRAVGLGRRRRKEGELGKFQLGILKAAAFLIINLSTNFLRFKLVHML